MRVKKSKQFACFGWVRFLKQRLALTQARLQETQGEGLADTEITESQCPGRAPGLREVDREILEQLRALSEVQAQV